MADNHKMWEELGMNLELHDQLCEVLPQAVGDVFLSQENRPEGMDYYDMVVADIHGIRPSELIAHQEKGGKVFGTFCVYVPDEVIFAADAIATGPVRSFGLRICISERRPATARRKPGKSFRRTFRFM